MVIFSKNISEHHKNTGAADVEKEREEGWPCGGEGKKLPRLFRVVAQL